MIADCERNIAADVLALPPGCSRKFRVGAELRYGARYARMPDGEHPNAEPPAQQPQKRSREPLYLRMLCRTRHNSRYAESRVMRISTAVRLFLAHFFIFESAFQNANEGRIRARLNLTPCYNPAHTRMLSNTAHRNTIYRGAKPESLIGPTTRIQNIGIYLLFHS